MQLFNRYYRSLFLICISLIAENYALSQDLDSLPVNYIDGITVYGLKYKEFANGSYQQILDSALMEYPSRSLSSLLQGNTSAYIKNYGNQMLSTISIRGTGAGHTSTLWNGINIGSPTLGQFDFSQAPSIVPDQLLLHYGGSSALFGNESIGGTVLLQSQSLWRDRPSLFIYQDIGSFGSLNTMLTFRANTSHFESATKIYLSNTANDFPFKNILLPGTPLQYQKNAKSGQKGLVQDFYWRLKSGQEASLHAWIHSSDRQLQPSMADPDSEDTQKDSNIRLQAAWRQSGGAGYFNVKLGFMHDYMLYNKTIATVSDQTVLQADIGKDLSEQITVNLGGSYQYIAVETENYSENVWENRWDLYAWLKFSPFRIWSVTANLRSAGSTSFSSPFAPSLGSELTLFESKNSNLSWESVASMNYRIPTLNDRYWNPGGNPLLQPEQCLSLESGFNYLHKHSIHSYEASIRLYGMSIDNWIIWLPDNNIWRPDNIREVRNSGLELNANGNLKLAGTTLKWNTSYSYTKATNQTQLDQYDRARGKQLPYVPYHNMIFSIGTRRSSWETEISANYTGERFTSSDNQEKLEPFWLADFRIGKSFQFIHIDATIANLLNATYYHLPYRAMPGRNYRFSISLKL